MRSSRYKALRCVISRGGFSDERVFSLVDVDYQGIASRRHLWKADGSAVEEGEPPIGQQLDGFVAARVIDTRDTGKVLVSVPDGEVITVLATALQDRPQGVGEHVPV